MIPADMERTAKAHLADARVLHRGGRFDGAVYLCGYALEIALKGHICHTLKWPVFPPPSGEYRSLLTHNLETLLWFSGIRDRVRMTGGAPNPDWSVVRNWNPEMRYSPVGAQTAVSAGEIIAATAAIVRILIP